MKGHGWRYDRPPDGLWAGAWTGAKWAPAYVCGPTRSAGYRVRCIECSRWISARTYRDNGGGGTAWPVKHSNPATGQTCKGAGFYGDPEWLAEYDEEVARVEALEAAQAQEVEA